MSKTPIPAIAALAAAAWVAQANAQTVEQGWIVRVHASVPSPYHLAFAPSGELFCGNGATTSGPIHRVVAGVVSPYGASLPDPDALVFDAAGIVSGVPGSVIVGGVVSGPTSHLSAVRPDQSTATLWNSTVWRNPHEMVFDSTGRLVFLAFDSRQIGVSTGGAPTVLTATRPVGPVFLAIDEQDRLFVSYDDGVIEVRDSAGQVLTAEFSRRAGRTAIEFPTAGPFPAELYALEAPTGKLLRFDPGGSATEIGSGFRQGTNLGFDIAFGPDGLLYVSDGPGNRVLRIQPCMPNCDGNAVLDIFDYLCFLNEFQANTVYTCNCDTSSGPLVCDIFDFLCFQNAFAAGCP